jgi:hypothetical protein
VRVDDATPGATLVGGTWTGTHVQGVSYMSFLVQVVDGEIGLHSGVPSSGEQSGLNGIQIRPATALDVGSFGATAPQGFGVRLAAVPNPARGPQTIEVIATGTLPAGARFSAAFAAEIAAGAWTLQILDVAGRVTWSEPVRASADGGVRITWDGRVRGASGEAAPAASGVYFARLAHGSAPVAASTGPALAAPIKLVRAR